MLVLNTDGAGQRFLLRQGLRLGHGPHFGRQGRSQYGHRRLHRRPFVVRHAAVEQVQYLVRRFRDLQGAARAGRYGGQSWRGRKTAASNASGSQKYGGRQPDEHCAGAQRTARRRGRTRACRAIRSRAAATERSTCRSIPRLERLRDVRRLYHHRGKLPFLAPEHHQQEVHHRKRLDDPVDRCRRWTPCSISTPSTS